MTDTREFPAGFVWGTATAAYQIEGAVDEDGRAPSIWDTFCSVPGNIRNGDTGQVACDHYHRMGEDLDLMAALGLPAYRFSVAWPRVLPDGPGKVNQVGLDFYQRLVDGLLERDITPLVTLYHWDLPQRLQENGGWLDRRTVEEFADYVHVVGEALGDRVPTFTTLNEPWCSAFLGYGVGAHAPGGHCAADALCAAHHLCLAHGRAARVLGEVAPQAQVSITLNLHQVEPASDSAADGSAAAYADAIANRIFLDPIFRGRYPADLLARTENVTDWRFVHDTDLAEIAVGADVLGVNYYTPARVAAADDDAVDGEPASRWPGTHDVISVPQPGPYTDMGWRIDPEALTALLTRVGRDYPGVPLVITENGCACADERSPDGAVHDPDRVEYLRSHLIAVHDALSAGVDVRGYYLWSFLDNFEWAWGYSMRFGMVYVDYATQRRTPKDSALWFRDVIRSNAVTG